MSKTVDGIILGMKVILEDPSKLAKEDNEVVPIPWNNKLFVPERKYRIGW